MTEPTSRAGDRSRRRFERVRATLTIVLALGALLVALALPGPLRAIVSLPILLIVPGYALQLALGRRLRGADVWLTVALSLILSAALLPLLVLLLYAVHRPLDSASIVLVVVGATMLLALAGLWWNPDNDVLERVDTSLRPDDAADGDQAAPAVRLPAHGIAVTLVLACVGSVILALLGPDDAAGREPAAPRLRLPVRGIAVALVLACTGVVILVTWAALPGATPAPYSAIALAGKWSRVSRVTVVPPGTVLDVRVQVQNHTATTQHYRLVPKIEGASWTTPAVTLAAGASWDGSVSGRLPSGGCLHRLRIALRCGQTRCTQSLVIWLADDRKLPTSCSTTTAGS